MKHFFSSTAFLLINYYFAAAIGGAEAHGFDSKLVVAQYSATNRQAGGTGSAMSELKSRVLSQQHVGPDFVLVDESAKDNRDAAKEGALLIDRPDDSLKRFEAWGSTGGYAITFRISETRREPVNPAIETDAMPAWPLARAAHGERYIVNCWRSY